METILHHPLLEVTNEELKIIRKMYNMEDVSVLKENLDAIQEWIQKQDHLAKAGQVLDHDILERLFLMARGSIEGTKSKIDKLFTTRGMMPELSMNKDLKEFEKLLECLHYVPLPKLNPNDQTRVMVTQFVKEKWENFNIEIYLRYSFLIGDYRLYCDYCVGDRYVIDLKNCNVNLIARLNPIILKKAEILATEGLGIKIKGIHFLNAPPFVDKIVFILKQGLKQKVASRLYVHRTYEEFHKEVSKEILPKDFDGDEPSISQIADQWKNELSTDKARDITKRRNQLISDESKRSEIKFNEEYLGMPGSFRKLAVD